MKLNFKLDYTYALIFEKLYYTRNIAQIAKELHMSREAVRKRVKKLIAFGRVSIKLNLKNGSCSRFDYN